MKTQFVDESEKNKSVDGKLDIHIHSRERGNKRQTKNYQLQVMNMHEICAIGRFPTSNQSIIGKMRISGSD